VLPARLFRTSSFRLTLLYAGLFSGSVRVLFVAIYAAIAGYMTRQLDRAIDAEISALGEEGRVAGIERLAALISERASATPRTGTVYLLQDPEGLVLAGNLRPRQPVVGWMSVRGRSRAAEGEEPHRIRARGMRLDDGSYLLVGQDANQLEQVEELIIRAFAWSAAATIVLALAGGMLMSASVLRRIGSIAWASRAIMAGDLSQRIPSRGVGDEFDQLAEALNSMIARIEGLMGGLRQVSNDIAHDLRTPLSRLRQRLEVVRRASPSIADYETLVDSSIRDADAILGTFAAMLRIAEVEATMQTAGFADVDLSEVLQTVIEVYESLAAEHSDMLTGHIAPNLRVAIESC
jgi:signal transduction histidine kinase